MNVNRDAGTLAGITRRLYNRLIETGYDRAIGYSLVLKSWQTVAGVVGMLLIAGNFSQETQGFYYTFGSLVALQSFVELGLHTVISVFASYEWSKLKLSQGGGIEGHHHALSRLVSLGRFAFKWYGVASLVFMLLAGGGGYWFLGRAGANHIQWEGPWIANIVFSALILWCMPFLSMLEGCDQMARIARFKTWQAIAANVALWMVMLGGGDLWAASAFSGASALSCVFYLVIQRREFFKPFLELPRSERVHWKREIFPMQWRIALQGVMGYFLLSLFTPVIFYYHGPAMAGQFGMTWQIVNAIQAIANIWVATKAPKFGMLVANDDFAALDQVWRNAALMSLVLMSMGVIVLFMSVEYLNLVEWKPVERVLPPFPLLMLALGAFFSQAVQCIAAYLRAQKKEVLTPVALVTGVLMALTVWQFGMAYGAFGAALSYFFVISAVAFPMAGFIWHRSRQEWHG